MQIGSLFSGIGGLDLGFEWEGFETVWFCENNEFCQKVLRQHWPGIPIYNDITKMDGKRCPKVDVLLGGFPCQDVSHAGRRAGIKEGTRSGLWFHYARLIDEIRPRWVVIENVPGLIGDGLDIVLGDLERIGYQTLQPILLEAATVGAPHKRERVFVVAYPKHFRPPGNTQELWRERQAMGRNQQHRRDGRDRDVADTKLRRHLHQQPEEQPAEARELAQRDIGTEGDVANSKVNRAQIERQNDEGKPNAQGGGEDMANSPEKHAQRCSWSEGEIIRCESGGKGWWTTEPPLGRVAHGVPDRVDKLKGLGNAVVPQCAQIIAQAIRFIEAQHNENTKRKG